MGIVYNVVYVIEDIKTVYSHWQSGMHCISHAVPHTGTCPEGWEI